MNQTQFAIAALAIVLSGVAGATAPTSIDARAGHALSASAGAPSGAMTRATTSATTGATTGQAARVPSGDPTPGPRRICCMW